MNKLFLIILTFFITFPAFANEKIDYKNINNNEKILFKDLIWSNKVSKKETTYFLKKVPEGITNYSEYYSPDNKFLFSTGTQYEFINNGSLIGYSNYDLKFYKYSFENNLLVQNELSIDEIQSLFPKYKIIKISDFSKTTNCLKIKKQRKPLKIILFNDTDKYFCNYTFTSNNAKLKKYPLNGFLKINKKGMIQFSAFGENTKNKPWFVLLVR